MKVFICSIMFFALFGNAQAVAVGVKNVYSTIYAFAALKNDGSVVTWGDARYGGDISGLTDDLSDGVAEIFSNNYAFVALKRQWFSGSLGQPSLWWRQ